MKAVWSSGRQSRNWPLANPRKSDEPDLFSVRGLGPHRVIFFRSDYAVLITDPHKGEKELINP